MRKVLLLMVLATFLGCGSSGNDYSNAPPPAPAPGPSAPPTWAQVKVILDANCEGCHNGSTHPALEPESAFRASPVAAQLNSGNMPPPPAVFNAADKAALLAFAAAPATPSAMMGWLDDTLWTLNINDIPEDNWDEFLDNLPMTDDAPRVYAAF